MKQLKRLVGLGSEEDEIGVPKPPKPTTKKIPFPIVSPSDESLLQSRVRSEFISVKIAVFGNARNCFMKLLQTEVTDPYGSNSNPHSHSASVEFSYQDFNFQLGFSPYYFSGGRRYHSNKQQILSRAALVLFVSSTEEEMKHSMPPEKKLPVMNVFIPGLGPTDLENDDYDEDGYFHRQDQDKKGKKVDWHFILPKDGEGKELLLQQIIEKATAKIYDYDFETNISHQSLLSCLIKLYVCPESIKSKEVLPLAIQAQFPPEIVQMFFELGAPVVAPTREIALYSLPTHEEKLKGLFSKCLEVEPKIASAILPAALPLGVPVVQRLIELGAKPSGDDFMTSFNNLFYAIQNKDEAPVIRYLVKAGMNLNQGDRYQTTPLCKAIGITNIPLIQFFLENGAKVGHLELGQAVRCQSIPIVEILIAAGGDIKHPHVIVEAASLQTSDILKYLINKGGNVFSVHGGRNAYGNATLEMRQYIKVRAELGPKYELLKRGLYDRGSIFSLFSMDIFRIFIEILSSIIIPFAHLTLPRAGRVEWVTFLDSAMRPIISDILNNMQFEGDVGVIKMKKNYPVKFICDSTKHVSGYDSTMTVRFFDGSVELPPVSIFWRSESYSCKGGGHPEAFQVTGMDSFKKIAPLLKLAARKDAGEVQGCFFAVLWCLTLVSDYHTRSNNFTQLWVLKALNRCGLNSADSPTWYQEAMIQWAK